MVTAVHQVLFEAEMDEACEQMGERRGAHRALVGKLEGKRPFGGPRHRWEEIG